MTHQTLDDGAGKRDYHDIATGETHRSPILQVMTGIGGLLALLAIGLVVLLVVLWKAP